MRSDDLETEPRDRLERLAPRDERREQQVAERPVVEQQLPQRVPVDGDVAQGLRDFCGQEGALPRQQVQLAEEVRPSLPHDLVAGAVQQRDLALENRDERVVIVAHLEEDIPHVGGALFPTLADLCELRGRERRAFGDPQWAWFVHRQRQGAPNGDDHQLRSTPPRHRAAGSRR